MPKRSARYASGFAPEATLEGGKDGVPFRPSVVKGGAVILALCALLPPPPALAAQGPRYASKYVNPAVYDGLFYIAGGPDKDGIRALVLSYDDRPIEPKANDPSAPTVPGFYPSYGERHDFERVEVIGKRVYFKTRRVGGVSYEFSGVAGEAVIPNFDPSIPVPYIRGTLTKLRNGKAVRRERVKFGHAVIA
jgi:hypothetical protein